MMALLLRLDCPSDIEKTLDATDVPPQIRSCFCAGWAIRVLFAASAAYFIITVN